MCINTRALRDAPPNHTPKLKRTRICAMSSELTLVLDEPDFFRDHAYTDALKVSSYFIWASRCSDADTTLGGCSPFANHPIRRGATWLLRSPRRSLYYRSGHVLLQSRRRYIRGFRRGRTGRRSTSSSVCGHPVVPAACAHYTSDLRRPSCTSFTL